MVEIGGRKLLAGGSGIGSGALDESKRAEMGRKAKEMGFGDAPQSGISDAPVAEMDREVVSLSVCWRPL